MEEDCEIERDTKGKARAEATQALEANKCMEDLIKVGPAEEGGLKTTRTQPLQSSGKFNYFFCFLCLEKHVCVFV